MFKYRTTNALFRLAVMAAFFAATPIPAFYALSSSGISSVIATFRNWNAPSRNARSVADPVVMQH
jgi:hypothetical protein